MRYYILLLFLIGIIGCKSNPKEEIVELTREHSLKNLTEVKLDLFEVNANLYPILDSIIDIVCDCPENRHEQIGFVLLPFQDHKMNGFTVTNIIDLNFQYYLAYTGVFYYKGYQFLIAEIDKGIVEKLNKKVTLYSISHEIYPYVYEDYKSSSSWTYFIGNDDFKCVSITHCDNVIKYYDY